LGLPVSAYWWAQELASLTGGIAPNTLAAGPALKTAPLQWLPLLVQQTPR
jgi:hypothetical protein